MLLASAYLVSVLSAGCSYPNSADSKSNDVAVHVDSVVRYQRILGFGGYGAKRVWWAPPPHHDADFVTLLVEDLGVTIVRDAIPISFEPRNDNDDPFDLDLEQFNLAADYPGAEAPLATHLSYLQALHKAGVPTFVASVWSPPPWMKTNHRHNNGTERETSAPAYQIKPGPSANQLRTDLFDEFAEYCVAYVKLLRRETGIDLHAISLQNEPRFSQWYVSSVHSPESLRDLIKVVGARFAKERIDTKVFMPEDVASMWHIRRYLAAIVEDPVANGYVDIFAIHNYGSRGVRPSDGGPRNWTETLEIAQSAGKEVWMSETSGFDWSTIDGGLELAKSIYNALHFGHVTAWIYWQMSDERGSLLMQNGTEKTFLYHVSKQFYRHIRPGAVRVRVSSSNDNLLALAFVSEADTPRRVVVLVNIGGNDLQVRLGGFNGPFTGYLTSSTSKHERLQGAVSATQAFRMPARSVMTLVAE